MVWFLNRLQLFAVNSDWRYGNWNLVIVQYCRINLFQAINTACLCHSRIDRDIRREVPMTAPANKLVRERDLSQKRSAPPNSLHSDMHQPSGSSMSCCRRSACSGGIRVSHVESMRPTSSMSIKCTWSLRRYELSFIRTSASIASTS